MVRINQTRKGEPLLTYSHTRSNRSLLCEQKTRLLRSGEVAKRVGPHPLTVRRWVKEGEIAAIPIGREARRRSGGKRIAPTVD